MGSSIKATLSTNKRSRNHNNLHSDLNTVEWQVYVLLSDKFPTAVKCVVVSNCATTTTTTTHFTDVETLSLRNT